MGEKHDIETFADLVNLYAKLPADRHEVMLGEVNQAVRIYASVAALRVSPGTLTWVDDDLQTGTVRFTTGEEVLGEVKIDLRATGEDSPANEGEGAS